MDISSHNMDDDIESDSESSSESSLETPTDPFPLLRLPYDILSILPDYLDTIDDYLNLASTCKAVRNATKQVSPGTTIRLIAERSVVFFRPFPYFLVTAVARDLGMWARKSDENERLFTIACQDGLDGLSDLALLHCGITIDRIRELQQLKYDMIDPVVDIIDQCVGVQWQDTPNFWEGGVDDAHDIPPNALANYLHLAIYGEIFGPEFEAVIEPTVQVKSLRTATRFEFLKYCLADYKISTNLHGIATPATDPRFILQKIGPYSRDLYFLEPYDHCTSLLWLLRSTKWQPHWRSLIQTTGLDFDYDSLSKMDVSKDELSEPRWRYELFMHILYCQGIKGLGMILPKYHDKWSPEIRRWWKLVSAMPEKPEDHLIESDGKKHRVYSWPYLLADAALITYHLVAGGGWTR